MIRSSTKTNARGAVLVEMAITVPFILLMISVTWDYTRIFLLKEDLQGAVIEGLRYGSRAEALSVQGRAPRLYQTIKSDCVTSGWENRANSEHCRIMNRILTLANLALDRTRGTQFEITEIETDYNLGPASYEPDNTVPCPEVSRTVSARVWFSYYSFMPFLPGTSSETSLRMPYLLIGSGENTNPAGGC